MTQDHEPLFDEDLRLLPWTSETGKPCHLAPGAEDGMVSALADGIENRHLAEAARVLRECEAIPADPAAGAASPAGEAAPGV